MGYYITISTDRRGGGAAGAEGVIYLSEVSCAKGNSSASPGGLGERVGEGPEAGEGLGSGARPWDRSLPVQAVI